VDARDPLGRERADAAPPNDSSLLCETFKRLAHGDPAYAIRMAKLFFRREQGAWREIALSQPGEEMLLHLVV
jgi:hypothetical protein